MSTRYRDGSYFDNPSQTAALHDVPQLAHDAAAQNARVNSPKTTVGHGVPAFGHNDIEKLAYEFWQARGCPFGSPEEDWSLAVEKLRSQAFGH